MKLNRTHALLLVGTIAAAGCVVDGADDDGAGGEGGEGSGAKAGSSGSAGSGTSGSAGSSSSGKGGSAGKGSGSGGARAGSGTSGGSAGAPDGEAGEGGTTGLGTAGDTSAAGAGGEPPTVCDDTQAVQLTCEDLRSDWCDDLQPFLDSECAMTWQLMKPSISNLARDCMLELKQSALCDAINTYDCIESALQASCPDDTVLDDCEEIVSGCEGGGTTVSGETCSTYMSGLTSVGRGQFSTCMSYWCDFRICAEGLTASPAEE